MAILVLGGAGYIGSHTVYELIDAGREVVVADNLQTGFRAAVHPKAKFYQLDIRDKGALDTLFQAEHIEGVIHFAASSQVGESMSDPLKYYDNNLHGTMVLLKSMVEHGVDKIVFSSTAATYGEPERVPILEDDKTVPTNCYGQTKLAMEHMMGWVSKAHGLRYVALRYFNACGAHPSGAIGEAHNPETHLIPIILQVPLGQREAVSIFGDDYPTKDGTCIRDYIHVTDLAQAHILAMEYLNNGGESNIFNIISVAAYGCSGASSVVIGKTIGSNAPMEKIREYVRTMQVIFLCIGVVSGAALYLARDAVISLFSVAGETLTLAREFTDVLCVTLVGTSYQVACLTGIVRGGGDTRFVLINDFIFMWLIVLPLSAMAAFWWNLAPVWVFLCLKCDQVLKCFVAVVKVNSYNWVRRLTR